MLSENFHRLLDIQLERYETILADCRPHVHSELEGDAALHAKIVNDVEKLKTLTLKFKKAAKEADSYKARHAAIKDFTQAGVTSTALWDYVFCNMGQASLPRRKHLTEHAGLLGTMSTEHATINLTVFWNLMDELTGSSKTSQSAEEEEVPSQKRARPSYLKLVE